MRDLLKANAGLIGVGLAAFVLMGASQSLYGPALPVFSRNFGVGLGAAGLLISAHWIGCALAVAVMYFHAARIDPRHAVGLMVLGAAILAWGPVWWAVLLGALVFGMGYGASTVVFNPRILQAFGLRGPAMVSLLNATFGLGAIAAPLVFVALGSRPNLIFGLVAAFGLLIWLFSDKARGVDSGLTLSGHQVFNPDFGLLAFGAVAIGIEATLTGLGPMALIASGQTEVAAAELLSMFFLGFLVVRLILIPTAHLVPPFTLLAASFTCGAAAALLAALVSPAVGFVALGLCAGLFFPSFFVACASLMGNDPRVSPTIIGAGLVGGISMPLVFAPLLPHLGQRGFFWVMAGLLVILAVASRAKMARLRRPSVSTRSA